jgi:outer membrane protein insertion porin family
MCIFSHIYSQSILILDVEVNGNQRVDRDLILGASGLRIGDAFNVDIVSNAIRALYNLNVFDDVDIRVSEVNNGVRLHITVTELPVITRYSFEGNKAISRSKIEDISTIRLGSVWSGFVQAENTRRILAEYSSKGYNLAEVNYRVRDHNDGVDVRVMINEGRKIVVRRINIHGNRELPSKRILGKMKTKPRGLFRSGTFERERFLEDQRLILDFYKEQGFIDARLLRVEENIVEERFLVINIFVEEGIQYRFGKVEVTGNSHFDSSAILSRFTLIEGEIFNMESFNRQLASVASMYYEEGFIYFHCEQQIIRDENTINIRIIIEENTRAKIHKIHILGNSRTKEKIIRRQLAVAPGDYFRQSRVIRSQQNVYNLGFFEPDMGLDYQPINHTGDVDLFLSVTDRTSGSANGGIGYNTRDSIVGQFSIAHNNILGNYWQGNLRWEFSKAMQNVEIDFTNPYLYDTDILFGFKLYHTQRRWVDFNYKVYQHGGELRLGYPIKAMDFTRMVASYSLYQKKYELWNENRFASDHLLSLCELGWQNTSSVSLGFTRDSRDNVFFPTSGSRFVLYNELAGGILGGDFNYFKQRAEVSWFTPVIWSTVLRTKGRVSYIEGYGNSRNEVPPDERFYLGGTGPEGIRGYPDRSIAPSDGGLREVFFSTELGFPIATDQLIGLFFLDTGNCYHRFSDFNFKDFKTGAGMGARIRTPFGLIGFDLARNFEEKRWEPHFQFGTNF